jgi:hypothetical protein
MRMIFATHVENRESILSIFQAFRPLKNYISPELTRMGRVLPEKTPQTSLMTGPAGERQARRLS